MHGGTRNKLTTWWATQDIFGELSILCDGRHEHAKWNPKPVGKHLSFPTAEEAAYPLLLCKRLVAILLAYARHMGAEQHNTLQDQLPASTVTSPLVSEFQDYKQFAIDPVADPEKLVFLTTCPKAPELFNDDCSGVSSGSMNMHVFGFQVKRALK